MSVQWIDVWNNAFAMLDGSIEARAHRAAQLAVEAFGEAPDEDYGGLIREVYVDGVRVTVTFNHGFIGVNYTNKSNVHGAPDAFSIDAVKMYSALVAEEIKA